MFSSKMPSHINYRYEVRAMDEEKLIMLVSKYDEIFDLSHRYYMDQKRKENIWEEISEDMGVSGIFWFI